MKWSLRIVLIGLALLVAAYAVTLESVHGGQTREIIDDTLPADDTLYKSTYFYLQSSVDFSDSMSVFYSTTDSLVVAIEGSIRADTTLFGWTALTYDTVTAGTTGYSVCLDNDTYYDILRFMLIALDDSLLTCEVYWLTRP